MIRNHFGNFSGPTWTFFKSRYRSRWLGTSVLGDPVCVYLLLPQWVRQPWALWAAENYRHSDQPTFVRNHFVQLPNLIRDIFDLLRRYLRKFESWAGLAADACCSSSQRIGWASCLASSRSCLWISFGFCSVWLRGCSSRRLRLFFERDLVKEKAKLQIKCVRNHFSISRR